LNISNITVVRLRVRIHFEGTLASALSVENGYSSELLRVGAMLLGTVLYHFCYRQGQSDALFSLPDGLEISDSN